MSTRRTFLKQSLTAAALPLIGIRQPQAICVCGHYNYQHDAAGWCLESSADGLDYADPCTLFTPAVQMWNGQTGLTWQNPSGMTAGPSLSPADIYPTSLYPQGGAALASCPPPDPGFRALLGGEDTSDGRHWSPGHSIGYYPRGFEGVAPKKINRKTPNWLRNRGVPENTVVAFQSYCQQFVANPGVIGRKIDAAWEEVERRYRACGLGTWQYNAVVSGPGFLTVVVEDTPFSICNSVAGNVWAVGTVELASYTIRVCIGHITNYLDDPTNATWIRDIDGLLLWECCLAVASRAGYHICTTQDESNLQNPCGLLLKTHC